MPPLYIRAILGVAVFFVALPAHARVGKVSSPEVEKGVAELEYATSRSGDNDRQRNNAQRHVVELEYGLTDRLAIGAEFDYRRSADDGNHIAGYGIETQYQTTTQRDYWLATAAKLEYFHADDSSLPNRAKVKFLAARTQGKWRGVANVDIAREIGANRDSGIDLSSAAQLTYRDNPRINPGLEWYGNYGPVHDFSDDSTEHYVGPIITGKLPIYDTKALGYVLGYYRGLTNDSADHAARVQVNYEFAF